MNKIMIVALAFVLLFVVKKSCSQSRWSFEIQTGVVYNLPLPLTIRQFESPDIKITKAYFETRPFSDPYYLDGRISKWFGKRSVSFEAIHDKLFLTNNPPEVQYFAISHGYNILTLNYGEHLKYFILYAGLGTVLVHPENKIREKEF